LGSTTARTISGRKQVNLGKHDEKKRQKPNQAEVGAVEGGNMIAASRSK